MEKITIIYYVILMIFYSNYDFALTFFADNHYHSHSHTQKID